MSIMNYILKDGVPVEEPDVLTWARWFEQADKRNERRVEWTKVGEAEVSTVFLGVDHGFGYTATPILFETMIFGGANDQWQRRYATLGEAKRGHFEVVVALNEGRQP